VLRCERKEAVAGYVVVAGVALATGSF